MLNEIQLFGNIIPPNSVDKYFFLIQLNENRDSISFDNTIKGHRILKQVNVGIANIAKEVVTDEWDMYYFVNGQFRETIHEKWIDKGKDDIINGTIFRQVWEIKTPKMVDNLLLDLNNFLWENKSNLGSADVTKRVKRDSMLLNNMATKLDKKMRMNL